MYTCTCMMQIYVRTCCVMQIHVHVHMYVHMFVHASSFAVVGYDTHLHAHVCTFVHMYVQYIHMWIMT